MINKKKKSLTKKDFYKAIKGTKSPQHATKVIPNKKKSISFDNADMGIGSGE
jgi:hypothetical protein